MKASTEDIAHAWDVWLAEYAKRAEKRKAAVVVAMAKDPTLADVASVWPIVAEDNWRYPKDMPDEEDYVSEQMAWGCVDFEAMAEITTTCLPTLRYSEALAYLKACRRLGAIFPDGAISPVVQGWLNANAKKAVDSLVKKRKKDEDDGE